MSPASEIATRGKRRADAGDLQEEAMDFSRGAREGVAMPLPFVAQLVALGCACGSPMTGDFSKVTLLGSFANDYGCMAEGYSINGKVVKSRLDALPALGSAGWAKPAKRQELALTWAQTLVDTNLDSAKATTDADGSIAVEGWTDDPVGMRPVGTSRRLRVRFTPAGTVVVQVLETVERPLSGPPAVAARIRGNSSFDDKVLRAAIAGQATLPEASTALEAFYARRGYAAVKVTPSTFGPPTLQVAENGSYRLGAVTFVSEEPDPADGAQLAKLGPLVTLKAGEPYDPVRLKSVVEQITAACIQARYPTCAVLPQTALDVDRHTADIRLLLIRSARR